MTLYVQKGQAQLQENIQDTCVENPVSTNVCPMLLRLADHLKVSIQDIVTLDDHYHLYTTCVQGEFCLVLLLWLASAVSPGGVLTRRYFVQEY